jgi:predicted benzoate:H+ symporter BenE
VSEPISQVVFHIPVTANKAGVQHVGSNIIFFNTANNQFLTLKNPVIDLAKGVVSAIVPQAGNAKVDILTITNASTAKPKITNDRKAKLRTTAYTGTTLVLAPGVAATIATVLGLPAGSLPDGLAFGTADVSLYTKLK